MSLNPFEYSTLIPTSIHVILDEIVYYPSMDYEFTEPVIPFDQNSLL